MKLSLNLDFSLGFKAEDHPDISSLAEGLLPFEDFSDSTTSTNPPSLVNELDNDTRVEIMCMSFPQTSGDDEGLTWIAFQINPL